MQGVFCKEGCEMGGSMTTQSGKTYRDVSCIDGLRCTSDGETRIKKLEDEADEFARDKLIPAAQWKKIISSSSSSLNPYVVSQKIGDRAKELGYSPSIAVARYKHESQRYNLRIYQSPKLT